MCEVSRGFSKEWSRKDPPRGEESSLVMNCLTVECVRLLTVLVSLAPELTKTRKIRTEIRIDNVPPGN
jgi:hypothetical protein